MQSKGWANVVRGDAQTEPSTKESYGLLSGLF